MACKLLQKRFGIKNVSIDKYMSKINTHFLRIFEETIYMFFLSVYFHKQ
jgi:hypothetical protein